jgi:zinc and cadmium transporter
MLEAFIAGIVVASLSLLGALFWGKSGHLTGTHRFVLPAAVGVFLGIVFFELIPETLEASHAWGPITILVGFLAFYLLSHFLETFHHHHFDSADTCMTGGARMLLWGDAIHNLADGVVIASAFMVNPWVGVLTTIGIALHEIPQEIAEFSVLLHSGCTRSAALIYNFASATSVILGIALTYLFAENLEGSLFILTGVAAGNLLYIATADLIPELRESHRDHFYKTFLATLIGIVIIGGLTTFSHEYVAGENQEETGTPGE